jgi:uncharacterized damage-inducible protein DinB
MFRVINDFFDTWKYERESTGKVFSALSNDALKQKSNDNVRALGRLAGHIVEFVLITHQIHHRAQMTVLMRLAGLKVPGVCGPAKEEWKAMGMPAME